MALIISISGIRGTIGGKPGEGLTPFDIVKYTTAYAWYLQNRDLEKRLQVVVGRDARLSGTMVSNIICSTLSGMGIDILDIGLTTTPTVEIAVKDSGSDGGIIITASHNPKQWNALKLLNRKGEFLSARNGEELLRIVKENLPEYSGVDKLGEYTYNDRYILKHINRILDLPLVDQEAIRDANLSVVIDAVNSTGGIAVPLLLEMLGVNAIHRLYCEPTGEFPHNPEPLPEHITPESRTCLSALSQIRQKKCDSNKCIPTVMKFRVDHPAVALPTNDRFVFFHLFNHVHLSHGGSKILPPVLFSDHLQRLGGRKVRYSIPGIFL